MHILRTAIMLGALIGAAPAAERSGNATVEWISSSPTCDPGTPLQTAIRMVVDRGWHTYWLNPGEAGMKTTVEWQLPAGWSASEPGHPVPKRFVTGGLAGFGYDGTVIFPVTLTPPVDFKGSASLVGKVSWLACNESGCVPGDARISLVLDMGRPVPTADAAVIRDALRKVPQPQKDWVHLTVSEKPTGLVLRIEAHLSKPLDLNRYESFPVTPQVVDPAAEIRFIAHGAEWRAEVSKSETMKSPVKQLVLVLAPKDGGQPMELSWQVP